MLHHILEVLRDEFLAFWRVPLAAVALWLVVIAALLFLVYSRTNYGTSRDDLRQGAAFVVVFVALAGLGRVFKR